jgi:asparagine synthase (glutamine-hydrolysing)
MGVVPLYMGVDAQGCRYIASELKALEDVCTEYAPFAAGEYFYSPDNCCKRWYRRDWEQYDAVKDNVSNAAMLRSALEDAVRRQLMSDVPYGTLLSGGFGDGCRFRH